MLREVLAVWQRMLGAEHPNTLSSKNNLATALQNQGAHAEAAVMLREVLHLKTGLAYLEHGKLLAAGEFLSRPEFRRYDVVAIPEDETYAANCIWVNDSVIMPSGYPRSRALIDALGYRVLEVDTSEYRKLDGGVSCMSLRF